MRSTRPSVVYLLVGGLSYPVLRLVYRLKWSGAEHLPRDGGYVLSANHNSNFDPWPLAIPLFPRRYFRQPDGSTHIEWAPYWAYRAQVQRLESPGDRWHASRGLSWLSYPSRIAKSSRGSPGPRSMASSSIWKDFSGTLQ